MNQIGRGERGSGENKSNKKRANTWRQLLCVRKDRNVIGKTEGMRKSVSLREEDRDKRGGLTPSLSYC